MVDLGYDHPVVARNRLTKELEDTKQQLEAAKAAVAKQEEELGRLKKDVESRAARLGEIEKELKGLAAPGGS
jgi:peptidoglycan hydrolase CwlO-like protein